ncbi:MAG: lytic transglycosylase domain-containing protein, partial [Maricaulis sp.]
LGINPEYYDSPYLQVHGGARYLATQLNTFDGNIINALAAYNAGPGRVFEYGGVPPSARPSTTSRLSRSATISI